MALSLALRRIATRDAGTRPRGGRRARRPDKKPRRGTGASARELAPSPWGEPDGGAHSYNSKHRSAHEVAIASPPAVPWPSVVLPAVARGRRTSHCRPGSGSVIAR